MKDEAAATRLTIMAAVAARMMKNRMTPSKKAAAPWVGKGMWEPKSQKTKPKVNENFSQVPGVLTASGPCTVRLP